MKQTIRTTDGKIYTGEVVEFVEYWYVSENGDVNFDEDRLLDKDVYNYNTLNYHKTREEAEAKRTYDLAVGEVTRRIEELGVGESIVYYHSIRKSYVIQETYENMFATNLPTMSEETAQTIIKEYKDTLLPVIFKMK